MKLNILLLALFIANSSDPAEVSSNIYTYRAWNSGCLLANRQWILLFAGGGRGGAARLPVDINKMNIKINAITDVFRCNLVAVMRFFRYFLNLWNSINMAYAMANGKGGGVGGVQTIRRRVKHEFHFEAANH